MFSVLVCGSRDWPFRRRIWDALRAVAQEKNATLRVIHGACRRWSAELGRDIGADHIAGCVARYEGWQESPYPAAWERDGRRAGPLRNQAMLDQERPALVLAFSLYPTPQGGTADMIKRARAAGIETRVFFPPR